MYSKGLMALLGYVISLLFFASACFSHPLKFIFSSDSVVIEGKVFDSETKSPIKAIMSFERIPGRDDIGVYYSDSITGNYRLIFKDSSKYKLTIQAANYITVFKLIELPLSDKAQYFKEIYLIPLKIGQVIVMNNLVFDKGKDQLLSESFGELDNIYGMLKEHPAMEIQLEGHTDNVGSSAANLKLSERRVNAVKDYLVAKGIKKNRIEVKAFGGSKPLVNNTTEEGRIKNRRVEIRILRN